MLGFDILSNVITVTVVLLAPSDVSTRSHVLPLQHHWNAPGNVRRVSCDHRRSGTHDRGTTCGNRGLCACI